MSGYRQSALLLHGLSIPDQRWILEQLSMDDQKQLRDHLVELKELGIPADRNMLANLGISETGGVLDDLQAASATEIQLILKDEPLWMLKQILSLEDWPWKQEFLAGLNATHASKIQHMQLPQVSLRVSESLRLHLLKQLKIVRLEGLNLSKDVPEYQTWGKRIFGAIGL